MPLILNNKQLIFLLKWLSQVDPGSIIWIYNCFAKGRVSCTWHYNVESVVIHWADPLSALRCRFDFWLFLLSFVLLYLGKKQKFILVHFSNILALLLWVQGHVSSSCPLVAGSNCFCGFKREHSLRQSIGSGLYIANLSLWLAWTY